MIVVVVTGTGTEIGKTWVTAATASALRERGISVAARKPVQSFEPGPTGTTDADLLAAATGETPFDVCREHRWLPRPAAPPMAAAALGLAPFTIADLVSEIAVPASRAVVFVESAGGVRSPLADDGDTVSLAESIDPALVVLVADAGLGTINLVRLSTGALADHRVVTYLNRFDDEEPLHAANRDWLRTREGLDIVTDVEALAEEIVRLVAATG